MIAQLIPFWQKKLSRPRVMRCCFEGQRLKIQSKAFQTQVRVGASLLYRSCEGHLPLAPALCEVLGRRGRSCLHSLYPNACLPFSSSRRTGETQLSTRTVTLRHPGRAGRTPRVRQPVTGPVGRWTGRQAERPPRGGTGQAAFNVKARVLSCLTLTEKKKQRETELLVNFFSTRTVFSKRCLRKMV